MLVSCISDTIAESKISALDMASNLLEFSDAVKEVVASKFNSLGLLITNFVIENISFPEQVEKAIDTRSSMGVLGDTMDTYVKYTAANAMGDAAKNTSGGNMASTGVGIGAGVAMADIMREAYSSNKKTVKVEHEEEKQIEKKTEKAKYCSECGAKMDVKAKFCQECGAKQVSENSCPNCGAKVNPNAKFCNECGSKLK
jgi:membrane protease subunit (stomatin/prohibitin family)